MAIAATTQIGDQGLTLGRSAAMLAGLPKSVPRLFRGPDVCRRDDRSHLGRRRHRRGRLRRCVGSRCGHMGRHPMGEGVDPNPRFLAEKIVDPEALLMGKTAENLHDRFPHLTKERA